MNQSILQATDRRGVATLTLNRADRHNAFDDAMIAELTQKLAQLNNDSSVRIVLLTGAGESFSAGADIHWMRSMIKLGEEENIEDALRLAELMDTLSALRKPTVVRVNGPAFGGGVGLVACCDIAIASERACFAFTEVRLGLVPAVISPYIIAAIGARRARRYFLAAGTISAAEAKQIGLVHEVVPGARLDDAVADEVTRLLKGGPRALAACKELIGGHGVTGTSSRRALKIRTAQLIAQLRVSDEGQEGLNAFLEKRLPDWDP